MFYCLGDDAKIGTIRETFFVSQLNYNHIVEVSNDGDFLINNKYTFEVGGKNKSFKQIKDINNSYLVIDTDNTQNTTKIPLFLFGFLY
jgi:hypothetical protein